jgi:hypothetical protein
MGQLDHFALGIEQLDQYGQPQELLKKHLDKKMQQQFSKT